jgi:TolA-binding protein
MILMAAVAVRAEEGDEQYDEAAGLYARHEWRLAADSLHTFLEKYPGHSRQVQAVFFLAESLLQLESYDRAAQRYQEYVRRQPEGRFARTALFRAAESVYFLNRAAEAKAEFQRFRKKYPNDRLNSYVLAYLGSIAQEEGDAVGAEGWFRQCLDGYPDGRMQDECRLGLARALEKQAKNDQAERYYQALALKTASPLAAESQFRLGALEYAGGKYAAAARTLEAFETLFPGSPWLANARLGRGWTLLQLDRPAEAATALEKVVADPKLGIEARYWLGVALKAQKNWPAAAKTFLEALAADPKHSLAVELRYRAGEALLHADDFAGAVEQFNRVLSDDPRGRWAEQALWGRVQAALRTKDHAAVDRDAAGFARQFPQSGLRADVERMSGRSLVERRRFQEAAEKLGPAVAAASKQDPRLEERCLLALAYEGLERRREGLDVLAPVIAAAAEPLASDARFTQASLLVALGRFEEAIAPLEGFLAARPTGDRSVQALAQLAVSCARAKRLDKAKARFAELVQRHPDAPLLATTAEQLADAAYEAGDTEWSGRLFGWLSSNGHAADRQARGLSGLGWTQYRAGRLAEAAATFDDVLRRQPPPALAAEAALIRGRILQQLGQNEGALAMYERVIRQHADAPQAPEALWAAARLHDTLKQPQQAAALYQRLDRRFPEFAQRDAVLYHWAWAAADLGQKERSAALFQRLCREQPQSKFCPDALFRLAQAAAEAKDYPQADRLAAALLDGRASGPLRENALYLSGQAALGREKWDAAERSLKTLLAEFPDSKLKSMAELGIAESMFRRGEMAPAAERLRRLSAETAWRDPSGPALVRLRLAQCLGQQQQWKQAYELLENFPRDYPRFEEQYEVDYLRGRCLADRADFDAARDAYRNTIRSPQGAKTETAAKAQLMIAESFFHQKNYEAALREYLRAEMGYAYPAIQAAALMQAAKCHELLGEWKQAVESYNRLLQTYPAATLVGEARERVQVAARHATGG